MSPRMTLAEVAAAFREAGIPIDNRRLSDGIVSGVYPFGRLVNVGENAGRRTFEIWRKDVVAYLATLNPAEEKPAPVPQAIAAIASPVYAKAAQIIKWATVCTSPRHQEADCMTCPYRTMGLCTDALLSDAASVLMEMTLGAVVA